MTASHYGLLQGTGLDIGPCSSRYPLAERTMLRVLSDRAATDADKDWVVFDGRERLTYGDAWRETCRVGHALDADLATTDHVGLMLTNQPEFLPAFYGSQVRGGVTVPLNAGSRGPLLQAVIEHSDVKAIVARTDLLDRLSELEDLGQVRLVVVAGEGPVPDTIRGRPVVRWDAWLDGQPTGHDWPLPAYDDVGLIQYTSGTTARQKGVVYPHHFLYLYSAMCTDSQEHTDQSVLTTPMPLFHVAALHLVVNAALHAGATAHLKSRFSASRFWSQCAEDGSTWAIILGPMAAMVMKMTEDPVPAHRVARMYCVPPPPGVDDFARRFGVEMIWQGFGMTEIYPLPMPARQRDGVELDTVGPPVRWMEFGVVDDHDELLPPGEIGEIVFRPRLPHAMAREYYRDPEQTVEAFRNFMFHTGDLGSYDGDGLLHYKSRKQERIRVKGENISAPELEWVALRHSQVVEAAAYAVPSPLGEDEVKLDVIVSDELTPADLHGWLSANVPRYMVPRYLEFRDWFPKTPSERIQKFKLREDPLDRAEVFDTATRAPEGIDHVR